MHARELEIDLLDLRLEDPRRGVLGRHIERQNESPRAELRDLRDPAVASDNAEASAARHLHHAKGHVDEMVRLLQAELKKSAPSLDE
jgi:hypothetical protein